MGDAFLPINGKPGPAPREGDPDMRRIAQPDNLYLNRAQNMGGILAPTVSGILSDLRNGWLERWVDLSGWMTRFDGHLRSVYYTRRSAVAGAPFTIEPPQNIPEQDMAIAAQGAEFLTRMLDGQRDFERLALQLLDGIGRGVSVAENIYGRDSGAWIARPEWIHTRRLRIAPDYSVRLWDQGRAGGAHGLELPAGKFIVHAPCLIAEHIVDSGELLACVWWWWMKTWGRKFYSTAADRFGSPRAIGVLPPNATASTKQALLDALDLLANDSSGIIEDGTRIEIQEPKASQSGEMWDRFIRALDDEMSKAMLGATDLSGPGENGARAAVETRNGVRLERAQADAKVFAGTLERDLFGPVLSFNAHLFGGKVPPTPRIVFGLTDKDAKPISADLVDVGGVTVDEMRIYGGLEPWGEERGGNAVAKRTSTQPQYGASGGAPAAAPFSQTPATRRSPKQRSLSQMKLPISTGTPSPTRSGSPSPLARALSSQSGGRSR